MKGGSTLNEIELNLLGDVRGKSILHLQCHFGQDSISLARLGAKVTGVDLSDNAVAFAKEFAGKTGADAKFICCNIYDLKDHLSEKFDIVFTSYGTISWLPDLNKWADIVSSFLKKDGKFVFVEFHPMIWMFDDNFEKIKYNYFNAGEINESETGSYADRNSDVKMEFVNWNHSLAEVVNSLIASGLQIDLLEEYDYSPHNCFNDTVEFEKGKFRIRNFDNKLPMVFSIVAGLRSKSIG